MEFVAIIIGVVALMLFFRRTTKKIDTLIENEITTEINENQVELTRRSMDALKELVNECGEDFMTPDEVYKIMHRRSNNKKEK